MHDSLMCNLLGDSFEKTQHKEGGAWSHLVGWKFVVGVLVLQRLMLNTKFCLTERKVVRMVMMNVRFRLKFLNYEMCLCNII